MSFKDFLIPLFFALLGTWLIQYFFFTPARETRIEVASDRQFIAPVTVQHPLDFSIDFVDKPAQRPKQRTTVTLPYGTITLSNDGAMIESIVYNRQLGGKPATIETVSPQSSKDRGAFLLALNGVGATPYFYELVGVKNEADAVRVSYTADAPSAQISKEFIFHTNSYVIDLAITIDPKVEVQARLFFPGPVTSTDITAESIRAILFSGGSIEKKTVQEVGQLAVENPTFFGVEDYYFVHTLIKDPARFAARGYFKVVGQTAQAVLQTQPITKKTSWQVSLYCGPKEMKSLTAVDQRLEGLLDYGWLVPLCRLLLTILNFLYDLVHNYGLAIILLTVLLRLLLIPFTLSGELGRRKQMDIQKKLQYLKQKYKNDPEQLRAQEAALVKQHGLPGMLGMLASLIQVPVFFGLQRVLSHAIELYRAPFLWIPDLSARDPYYILPALVGASLMVQLAQSGGDFRQNVAHALIAIIVAALTANLSAGLCLFIVMSTVLWLLQSSIQKALKL